MNTRHVVRIVVACPGDVQAERASLESVIAELNRGVAADRGLQLVLQHWEADTYPSFHRAGPQGAIDSVLRIQECDLLIAMFWKRFGTATIDSLSGTAHEIELAYRSWKANGRPDVMLYFNRAPYSPASKAETEQAGAILELRHAYSAEALSWDYEGVAAFEKLARTHLIAWLRDHYTFTAPGTAQHGVDSASSPTVAPTLQATPEDVVLTWSELTRRIAAANRALLGRRYRDKYDVSCYLPRDRVFSDFARFAASDKSITVLTGRAGTGKSALVCHLPEALSGDSVVYLHDCACVDFNSDWTVDSYLRQQLSLRAALLPTLERLVAEKDGRRLLLVFDGVNEAPHREALLERLADFGNAINESRVKLVVTCRTPTWGTIRQHFAVAPTTEFHASGPGTYVNIEMFADAESVHAYEKFRIAYSIETPHGALTEQVRHFLRQPLLLRLAAESFRGRSIPSTLALRDVFAAYVVRCVKCTRPPSAEYTVLHRIVYLLCATASSEIRMSALRDDPEIGRYCNLEDDSPIVTLLDAGLLSSQVVGTGLRGADTTVFVTHERIFEFLVADEMLGALSPEAVVANLERALARSFPQLRGATELALSLSILENEAHGKIIVDIAHRNRPETRQLLCDVTQTLYESGHHALAKSLVHMLSVDDAPESTLVALQAAYQLRLDDVLVSLAVSRDVPLRDVATLYLYQRWNAYRIHGQLAAGYELFDRVRPYVLSVYAHRALAATLSLSLNLLIHLIDDPLSLSPLVEFYRTVFRGLRGVALDPMKDQGGRVERAFMKLVIRVLTPTLLRLLPGRKALASVFQDRGAKRALLDIGSFITQPDLREHAGAVRSLLLHRNAVVAGSSKSVLLRAAYRTPERHLPLLQDLLDDTALPLPVRGDVLWSMTYALISRVLKGEGIQVEWVDDVADNLQALWYEDVRRARVDDIAERAGEGWFLEYNVFGLLLLEALIGHGGAGRGGRSTHLPRFFLVPDLCGVRAVSVALRALQKVAYQGHVEFAIATLLDEEVKPVWLRVAEELGVDVLANARAFRQDSVDPFLRSDVAVASLWAKVRDRGTSLDPVDF